MSREVDDFFDELETNIPDDVSRLVEKQLDIADAIVAAIDKSKYKNTERICPGYWNEAFNVKQNTGRKCEFDIENNNKDRGSSEC